MTTWWFIPLSEWVITLVISGLTPLIPFITRVITHLLSGMNHQVLQGRIEEMPIHQYFMQCPWMGLLSMDLQLEFTHVIHRSAWKNI